METDRWAVRHVSDAPGSPQRNAAQMRAQLSLPPDRIDQIAAVTAVASTDRSKEEEAFPKLTLNPNLLNQ